jgi:hypothetical protein
MTQSEIRVELATIVVPFTIMHHIDFGMLEASAEGFLDGRHINGDIDDYSIWWDVRKGTPYFCSEILFIGAYNYQVVGFKFKNLSQEEVEDNSLFPCLIDDLPPKKDKKLIDAYDKAMKGV